MIWDLARSCSQELKWLQVSWFRFFIDIRGKGLLNAINRFRYRFYSTKSSGQKLGRLVLGIVKFCCCKFSQFCGFVHIKNIPESAGIELSQWGWTVGNEIIFRYFREWSLVSDLCMQFHGKYSALDITWLDPIIVNYR